MGKLQRVQGKREKKRKRRWIREKEIMFEKIRNCTENWEKEKEYF